MIKLELDYSIEGAQNGEMASLLNALPCVPCTMYHVPCTMCIVANEEKTCA